MRIRSGKDLGILIRRKRKEDGLTLAEAANLCNVGYVFLSALENGKPTVQLDKVFQVIDCLGIELYGAARGLQAAEKAADRLSATDELPAAPSSGRSAQKANEPIGERATDIIDSPQVPAYLRVPHHGGFKILISKTPPEPDATAEAKSKTRKAKVTHDE
ncbi:hypothetical protein GMSM_04050 [Geomonas sp. Red276]